MTNLTKRPYQYRIVCIVSYDHRYRSQPRPVPPVKMPKCPSRPSLVGPSLSFLLLAQSENSCSCWLSNHRPLILSLSSHWALSDLLLHTTLYSSWSLVSLDSGSPLPPSCCWLSRGRPVHQISHGHLSVQRKSDFILLFKPWLVY